MHRTGIAAECQSALQETYQMRTEISPDGEELLLHIPIRMLTEGIGLKLASREVNVQKLSPREREVFQYLRAGKVNKEIAAGTNISVRTVKFHLSNIYRKLHVRDREEAFRLYG